MKRGEVRELMASIVEHSDDAIIAKNLDAKIMIWNQGAARLFGYSGSEAIGRPITLLIPEDRRDEESLILARVLRGERIDHYETTRQRKDGSQVDVSLTISPIRNRDGKIIGASKVARDITERRLASERQNLLLEEMKHRTKNLAAVIEALARQSRPRNEPVVDSFISAFIGRLHALLATGALILGSSTRHADFREILDKVLLPFIDPNQPSPIVLDGPPLALPETTAGNLALAVHELATNSLKYGTLKGTQGKIFITWSVQHESHADRVQIEWKEIGGNTTAGEPRTAGFGTRVIRSAVAGEKDGKTELAFEPDGLRCRLEFLASATYH